MSSMKCPQCGLVNWVTAEACKRCKLPFVAPSPAPSDGDEQAPPAGADEAQPPAADAHAETAPGHAAPPPPRPYLPQQQPYLYDARAPHVRVDAVQAHAPRRSPYDLNGADEVGRDGDTLDIDFEVSPFVDTSMTIRDTYAMSRSQIRLIARVVLTAIAPHALLTLAVGANFGSSASAFPAGALSFLGASPASPAQMGQGDYAGMLSLFLLMLIGYYFVRWAVMPSALVYGLVTSLNTGEAPGLLECYRWGLRRSVSSGLSLLLSVVLTCLGLLLLIVPGIYLAIGFTLVMPIAAIEGCGAIEVMRRSWNLSRGRRGTIFLSSFAWGVLIFLFTLLATLLMALVAGVLRSSVIGSVATLLVTEIIGATGIVLSLVIYLGIAHYGRPAGVDAATHDPSMPATPGDFGGPSSPGGFVPQAGGWGPQPALAAPGGYAYAGAGDVSSSGAQKTTIIALVACGALVLLAFLAIVASIAVPNLYASRRAANEGSAISNLRLVMSAEATYYSLEGKYETLSELGRKQLITPKLASGEMNGYKFEVKVSGEDYEVTATPLTYGSTGTRSFYSSADGVIRVADRRGLKARAGDPPLNENTLGPPMGGRPGSDVVIDPGGRVAWPGAQ